MEILFGLIGGLMLLVEWIFTAIGTLLPVVGVAICVVAAGIAVLGVIAIILIIRAAGLLRAKRQWVRVVGWVLVSAGCILVVCFVTLSIIAGAAVSILS